MTSVFTRSGRSLVTPCELLVVVRLLHCMAASFDHQAYMLDFAVEAYVNVLVVLMEWRGRISLS